MPQTPYSIKGTVQLRYNTQAGVQTTAAVKGAIVWAQDITEGTFNIKEKESKVYTNDSGEYNLDLANMTSAYANSDTVRVYVQYGDIVTYSDVTINIKTGISTENFTLIRRSGLLDGLKKTLVDGGKGGLEKFARGLKKGMKDGMI